MQAITVRKLLSPAVFAAALISVGAAVAPRADAAPATNSPTSAAQIPPGTVLPLRLNHGFSAKSAQAGTAIFARVMQDVPLPNGQSIPRGATVSGAVLSVSPAANGSGDSIAFSFKLLEMRRQRIPVVLNLRALASSMAVSLAEVPDVASGFGTPAPWATRTQIGGDVDYGVGAEVTGKQSQPVGKGVFDGVLVHVKASAAGGCRGAFENNDGLQALWVFSADACGVYGLNGLRIANAGRTAPVGVIVVSSENGDAKIPAGSGMLLRVAP